MDDLSWTCHICSRTRPDERISVMTTDLSAELGFPAGTFKQNVRYCNDSSFCEMEARTYRFTKPKPKVAYG